MLTNCIHATCTRGEKNKIKCDVIPKCWDINLCIKHILLNVIEFGMISTTLTEHEYYVKQNAVFLRFVYGNKCLLSIYIKAELY